MKCQKCRLLFAAEMSFASCCSNAVYFLLLKCRLLLAAQMSFALPRDARFAGAPAQSAYVAQPYAAAPAPCVPPSRIHSSQNLCFQTLCYDAATASPITLQVTASPPHRTVPTPSSTPVHPDSFPQQLTPLPPARCLLVGWRNWILLAIDHIT